MWGYIGLWGAGRWFDFVVVVAAGLVVRLWGLVVVPRLCLCRIGVRGWRK